MINNARKDVYQSILDHWNNNDVGTGPNQVTNGTMDSTLGADAVVDGTFDTGYGFELVTNGTFDSDITGWTDTSTGTGSAAWNSGQIELINPTADTANTGSVSQAIAVEVGKPYRITATRSGGNSYFQAGNNINNGTYISGPASTADIDRVIVPPTTPIYISLRNINSASNCYVDNVTVREVVGVGPELVTNGTFDSDITGWTDNSLSGGSSQWDGVGQLELLNPSGDGLKQGRSYQAVTVVIGKTYRVQASRSGGASQLFTIGNSILTNEYFYSGFNTNDVDVIIVPTTTTIYLLARNWASVTPALIDNVSVTEMLDAEWTQSDGAGMVGGACRLTSDGGSEYVLQPGYAGTQGKLCEISIEITDATAGGLLVGFEEAGVFAAIPGTVGTHTALVVNNGPLNRFAINRNGVTDITFDNVTVKEVIETDWTKTENAIIYGGVCRITSDGTLEGVSQTGHAASEGNSVDVVIDITDSTAGQLSVGFVGGTDQLVPASVGTHTLSFLNDGTSGTFQVTRASGVTDVSFTIVSVREPSGVFLTFANEAFDPPINSSWVRVTMIHTGGSQDSLGGTSNRKFLRSGNIIAQVFTPQDRGLSTSDVLTEAVLTSLEGLTFTLSNIRTYGASISEIGLDNGWYQVNVDVPFEYDVLK